MTYEISSLLHPITPKAGASGDMGTARKKGAEEAENCQNGGLTRFAEIKRQVSTRLGGFKRIRIFRQQLTTETLSLIMKTVSH